MRNVEKGGRRMALIATAAALSSAPAMAFKIDAGSDWSLNLDNSITYNIGMRVQSIDPRLGNNPNYDESEYKFGTGKLVTDRVQDFVEAQAVYQDRMGVRFTGSMWKDFAYDASDKSNPGVYAPAGTGPGALPAITYASISSYKSGEFSDYTRKYQLAGYELLDAFAFYNTTVGDIPVYAKVGRLTQYWGNAFFYGFQGISYSQNPVDFIKGFTAPGSEVKELFLPRTQALVTANLTQDLSVSAQYFAEFANNRFPEGGTFLSPTDFAYSGPDRAFLAALPASAIGLPAAAGYAPFEVNVGNPLKPGGTHANYGVKVAWSPEWARGDLGFYYRHFDEAQPWLLVDFPTASSAGDYHLAYNRNVRLYGLSYEHSFGPLSTGWEVSYKHHMGLASTPSAAVPVETEGATGNVLNVMANALWQLGSTPLYDTGNLIAEVAYTHLTGVTHNDAEALYNGVGYPTCPTNSRWDGCSTRNAVAVAISFDPQWLQVLPSIDLDMPISDNIGVYGNGAFTAGGFYGQANQIYSGGLRATYKQVTSVALQYNAIYGRPNGTTTTPAGAPVYKSGNGLYQFDDRGWISLTIKTSF